MGLGEPTVQGPCLCSLAEHHHLPQQRPGRSQGQCCTRGPLWLRPAADLPGQGSGEGQAQPRAPAATSSHSLLSPLGGARFRQAGPGSSSCGLGEVPWGSPGSARKPFGACFPDSPCLTSHFHPQVNAHCVQVPGKKGEVICLDPERTLLSMCLWRFCRVPGTGSRAVTNLYSSCPRGA